ncbi:MAG: preprotein translocase subunit SecG [Candidatus Ryanbacteria bacterium RIFCSPHIGHO2_02_FULL_45_13b]|uniref:Protein-export membrane protein SecG n=1 Tax=Candidatus Ryanbacteria bacterium RIFCSPHIGHO2_02_FULL_45_13b TaxID=1802117 RepID=A0A1G2G6X8_9BACT|nr:MAG: preprotein translocase subunit SecG [Candidatus Ryanbacteria bacterium RIFCSPHIGHO2_02_FULL_45_13b]
MRMVRYVYNMTQQILSYVQIAVAVLLGVAILFQQKGQGLSGAFGGEGGFYRTKRGLEKILLILTIILAILFLGIGLFRISLSPTTPLSDQQSNVTEPAINGNSISIPSVEINTESVSPTEGQ